MEKKRNNMRYMEIGTFLSIGITMFIALLGYKNNYKIQEHIGYFIAMYVIGSFTIALVLLLLIIKG